MAGSNDERDYSDGGSDRSDPLNYGNDHMFPMMESDLCDPSSDGNDLSINQSDSSNDGRDYSDGGSAGPLNPNPKGAKGPLPGVPHPYYVR